jgi:hypothetical protein
MTNFLTQSGAPFPEYDAIVLLFMMLPLAITVVVIGRQIIGIKGFGIAAPVLVGYAYLATGIQAGTIIFFAIFIIGFIIKSLLKNIRLLYLPKMALILIAVTVGILILFSFLPYRSEIKFPEALFSLLIFVTSAEQFASFLIEHGPRKTLGVILETLSIATAIFFLITWQWLQNIVLSYPIFVLAAIVLLNFFLGKWTGLRISEYIRFKNIIFK